MTKSPENLITPPTTNPETWVDAHGDYLYNFALGRLRNPDDAENAVQETFLAALKALNQFEGKSSERTWLTGILKHKIVDCMRKSYREKPVSSLVKEDAEIDQFFDETVHMKKDPGNWLPDTVQLLENKEFWSVFEKCKEKLPKNAGDAFTLREIEQMDSPQVCEVLGITSSNLWVLLHRARLQLRQCLETNWFEK